MRFSGAADGASRSKCSMIASATPMPVDFSIPSETRGGIDFHHHWPVVGFDEVNARDT